MNNNVQYKHVIIPDSSSVESQKFDGRYDIYKNQIVDNKTQKIWQRDWGLFQSTVFETNYRQFENGARKAYSELSEMPKFKNMIPRNNNNDYYRHASPCYRDLENLIPGKNFYNSQELPCPIDMLEDIGFKNVRDYPVFVEDSSLNCGQSGPQLTHDESCFSLGIAYFDDKDIRLKNVHNYLKDSDWNPKVKGKFIFHSF